MGVIGRKTELPFPRPDCLLLSLELSVELLLTLSLSTANQLDIFMQQFEKNGADIRCASVVQDAIFAHFRSSQDFFLFSVQCSELCSQLCSTIPAASCRISSADGCASCPVKRSQICSLICTPGNRRRSCNRVFLPVECDGVTWRFSSFQRDLNLTKHGP